jgi:hypothetical protein
MPRGHVEVHAEVVAIDQRGGGEPGVGLAVGGMDLDTPELDREGHRLGDPVDREVAGQLVPVVARDARGRKRDLRVLFGGEEVGAEQMRVAVGLVGVDGGRSMVAATATLSSVSPTVSVASNVRNVPRTLVNPRWRGCSTNSHPQRWSSSKPWWASCSRRCGNGVNGPDPGDFPAGLAVPETVPA